MVSLVLLTESLILMQMGSSPPSETLLTYIQTQPPTFLLEFALMHEPEKEEYET